MKKQTKHFYQFGPYRLDLAEGLLMRGEQRIPLTPKSFAILLVLVENAGHVIEKEALLKKVWPDTFVEEVNLAKNISGLRRILGGELSHQYIETIPKRGYRFVASVTEVWDQPESPAEMPATGGIVPGLEHAGDAVKEVPNQVSGLVSSEVAGGPGTLQLRPGHSSRRLLWPAGLLVVAVAAIAAWFTMSRIRVTSTEPPLKIIPLTSYPGRETHPAFSNSGDQIAFAWDGDSGGNTDIYVKELSSGQIRPLIAGPDAESNPAWSPDGRFVAFLRQSMEISAFYLVPSAGGPDRKIADVLHYRRPGMCSSQYYSPDGSILAVSDADSLDEPQSIYFLHIEGGAKRKITTPPSGTVGDSYPAFSPDGKLLAFLRTTSMATTDIYLMPLHDGVPRRLTVDNSSILGLSWTPDGREIVFSSRRGSSIHNLWRVRAVGGAPERLPIAGGQRLLSPAISLKGQLLAYSQSWDDLNIWRLELNASGRGVNATPLAFSTFNDNGPDYSPEGRKIVFASSRTGEFGIWVCDQDGANPDLLVSGGPHLTGTPRWSPDGRWIAYDSRVNESGEEGNADIFVIHTEDRTRRRLTEGAGENVAPSWSRDGKWIYFGSTRSGSMQIWKMPFEGGQAIQLTRYGGFEGFESPDGKVFYYSKGRNLPGIWQIPAAGGEEKLLFDHDQAGYWRLWAVADQGIYFATAMDPTSPAVEFYSFDTGKVMQVAAIEKPLSRSDPGMSVSRDGRWLVFTRLDHDGSDLMLVENFR